MKKFLVLALLACGVMVALHFQQQSAIRNGVMAANVSHTAKKLVDCTNCTGQSKKCINNVCETGSIYYTSSQVLAGTPVRYRCFYHYEWSDGSISPTYYVIQEFQCRD
ncbi:hypothetical protein [Chitinophaga sp.]|uniref:hypothetical protein n=1 Tax=Chitinophaga sp. TaxID=1869181 RepID=UPI002F9416C1